MPAMPNVSRATRGKDPYRQLPRKTFKFQVKTRYQDGSSLARGETFNNERQGYLGPVLEGKVPYLTTTTRADFMSAFNKRVNYHSSARIDRRVRGACRRLIHKLVPRPMDRFGWDTDLYRGWLEQFDTEKQARMEKAYVSQGLDRLSEYSRKEVFTKIEALVKDPEEVAPRVIFKGSDYYNMISGPIFKVLMERFKSLEERQPVPEFDFLIAYKQHTPEIVEFLDKRPCKSWMEADFSANDKSQVKDVQELEIMFMNRLGCPKWFLDLHRKSNTFSANNTKYGVSAIVENQLPTGATDTTFRNSFWNMCIYHAWATRYNVQGSRVCILGDDMLAGLTKRVRRCALHYEQVASAACMIAEVTTAPSLDRMHFLSKHFIPVTRGEQTHVMLPFVGKVLAKFNCRPNTNEAVSDDEYMAGKSLSHCYEFRFCHVLRDLFVERANYHLRRSGGKFSLEGLTYHVRVFSVHKGLIESMLSGATTWPDLVSADDLSDFWMQMGGVAFSDVFPLVKRVVLGVSYELLDHFALFALRDY